MVSRADAEALRQAQVGIRPLVERDLAAFWGSLDLGRPEAARDALLEFTPVLVSTYGESAAAVAADWYDEMRAVERVPGRFRAVMQDSPYMDAVDGTVRRAAGDLFTDSPDGTLATLAAVVPKYVLAAGRQTITRSTDLDPQASGWRRVTRSGACSFCRMLEGRGGVYRESTVHFASHNECVVEGTIVTSPDVEAATRRWYEGELITLRTASGQELTITPNHPVLTDRGWVAAGRLTVGDNLLRRTGADAKLARVPYEEQGPTRIEEVWSALRMADLRTVPVAAEDFHGDTHIGNSDVEVVTAYGFLPYGEESGTSQRVQDYAQPGTVFSALGAKVPLSGLRSCGEFGVGFLASPGGIVSSSGPGFALCGAHSAVADLRSFGRAAMHESGFGDPSVHGAARHTVVNGHRQDALSGVVTVGEIGWYGETVISRVGVPRKFNPTELEGESQALSATRAADLGSDLLERLSGLIEADRLVDVNVTVGARHVLNLQTAEGWYAANSLIVSNCNCAAAPSWDPDAPEVDVELYRASERTTRMSPEQRERHNAAIREYLGD